MWGNVVMGVAGVTTAYLSRSDALMIDGLYSLVNFVSAIIAMRVAKSVHRKPDATFPYGYYAHESLYVLFRSLVLLGILLFACFSSLNKIIFYVNGGEVTRVVMGPVLLYSFSMVLICFSLSFVHHRNWLKTGKQSDILQAEKSAGIADGFMSAGVGGALLGVGLLSGTFLEGMIPVADSVLVLVLCCFMLGTPASLLRKSMAEIAGKSSDPDLVKQTRHAIKSVVDSEQFELIDFNMTKLGRSHFCISHIHPKGNVTAAELDSVRAEVQQCCQSIIATPISEVVFTQYKAF